MLDTDNIRIAPLFKYRELVYRVILQRNTASRTDPFMLKSTIGLVLKHKPTTLDSNVSTRLHTELCNYKLTQLSVDSACKTLIDDDIKLNRKGHYTMNYKKLNYLLAIEATGKLEEFHTEEEALEAIQDILETDPKAKVKLLKVVGKVAPVRPDLGELLQPVE